MKIKFIGQGLDQKSETNAGNLIIESLDNQLYNSFRAFVAFVSVSGLNNIIDQLVAFKQGGGLIRLYLGVDFNGTSLEALEVLLEREIESYIVYSPNKIVYHPKIYAFEGISMRRTIIGSSNLTESGLFHNIEASLSLDFNADDENGIEFLSNLYDHFNDIINLNHASCKLLTKEVLDILVEAKVVLPEAVNRSKTNKVNNEFGKISSLTNTKLLSLFGRIKTKRPPKGFRKTISKQTLILEEDKSVVNVVDETSELISGSMWIETGKMTGGSRNILDLSKKGKLNGVVKFGSVSFFGVNPNRKTSSKDINIMIGDKVFRGNHIFYAAGNSNWRIRLNGVTDEGDKITEFSKPSLGENGGFQYKILLFTKISDNDYKLDIADKEELNKLIEHSSDWAKGGNETTGRAYGIIR